MLSFSDVVINFNVIHSYYIIKLIENNTLMEIYRVEVKKSERNIRRENFENIELKKNNKRGKEK